MLCGVWLDLSTSDDFFDLMFSVISLSVKKIQHSYIILPTKLSKFSLPTDNTLIWSAMYDP